MEIEYNLTPEDVIAFQQYTAEHRPGRQRPSMGSLWLLLALLALFTVLAVTPGGLQGAQLIYFFTDLAILLLTLAFIMLQPRITKMVIARSVRQVLRHGNNARVLESQRVAISPEGLTSTSSLSSGLVNWAALEKIVVTDDHAFFFTTTHSAQIVPKRAFPDGRTFHEFVETARSYHQAAAKA
jgi:hypothetical protein